MARVSQAGVVLDPGGIPLPMGGGMYLYELNPSVAFNGTNHLVAWQEATDIIGQDHILGARVSPSGAVLEAMTITLLGRACRDFPGGHFGRQRELPRRLEGLPHRCLGDIYGIPWSVGRHGAAETSRSRMRPASKVLQRSLSTARTTSSSGRTTARVRRTTSTARV